jgi:hypothetical protein
MQLDVAQLVRRDCWAEGGFCLETVVQPFSCAAVRYRLALIDFPPEFGGPSGCVSRGLRNASGERVGLRSRTAAVARFPTFMHPSSSAAYFSNGTEQWHSASFFSEIVVQRTYDERPVGHPSRFIAR